MCGHGFLNGFLDSKRVQLNLTLRFGVHRMGSDNLSEWKNDHRQRGYLTQDCYVYFEPGLLAW